MKKTRKNVVSFDETDTIFTILKQLKVIYNIKTTSGVVRHLCMMERIKHNLK